MIKLGNGCSAGFKNVTVAPEGIEDMLDIGQTADGMTIALENVTISQKLLDIIHKKMGSGCNISAESYIVDCFDLMPPGLAIEDNMRAETVEDKVLKK